MADILEIYKQAKNRLILLDYDGTLVDFTPVPEDAVPSIELLYILRRIASTPNTKLIIISGRNQNDIENFVGELPIDIIAEHGAMLKKQGKWQKQNIDISAWKEPVLAVLNETSSSCPGSFVEEKTFSLAWHYRNAETGYEHARKLINTLENINLFYNFKILDGNKVVEIKSIEIGKGKATKYLVEKKNYDFILSVGDDKTDEEMFEFLVTHPEAITIKVGEGNTMAKYLLENVDNVIKMLKRLL
ncbi:MAG: trehalose-phosphatase [Paludibacter sp.]|nr:trehalose-phosphatase [Paludibacter sp.]